MSEKETLQGLNCPNCGGVISIPEGQVIVRCPYCDLRSFVRGERGLRRFQVPQAKNRDDAVKSFRQFLSGNLAIAMDASRRAELTEVFLVYLPFWVVWARVMGWAFGQEEVGSGDRRHYEPREVRIVEEMTWDAAACDVGEFGVNQVPLTTQELDPFNSDALRATGLVFEPVGSFSDAKSAAAADIESRINRRAGLDRLGQLFVRFFRQRFGLVYYPLWVLRYLYRGRAFQVVVDGSSGKVLYGKAPGNVLYRAAVLVGGMILGAFLAVDVPGLVFSQSRSNNSGGFALVILVVGLGLMYGAYRTFRYGEQYEFRSGGSPMLTVLPTKAQDILGEVGDISKWVNRLS
jgi:hypothetical protein